MYRLTLEREDGHCKFMFYADPKFHAWVAFTRFIFMRQRNNQICDVYYGRF